MSSLLINIICTQMPFLNYMGIFIALQVIGIHLQ